MPWLDLHADIAEEFSACLAYEERIVEARLEHRALRRLELARERVREWRIKQRLLGRKWKHSPWAPDKRVVPTLIHRPPLFPGRGPSYVVAAVVGAGGRVETGPPTPRLYVAVRLARMALEERGPGTVVTIERVKGQAREVVARLVGSAA